MSITAVRNQISKAMQDLHVTDAEVQDILKAAKPALSNGEVKALGDLYDRVTTRPKAPPGAQICFITSIDQPALNRLNTFIAAKNLPIGANKAALKAQIGDVLATVRLDSAGIKKPAGLSKLVAVELSDPRMLGGPMRRAYVNVATKQFFLSEDRPILNNSTKYWGPFALPTKTPAPPQGDVVSDAKRATMLAALNTAAVTYQAGGVMESHLGVRFAKVPLFTEKHPDGFTYTAYLPLGALTPTAPQKDPNAVKEMYIERTGGLAGITMSAGPIAL